MGALLGFFALVCFFFLVVVIVGVWQFDSLSGCGQAYPAGPDRPDEPEDGCIGCS